MVGLVVFANMVNLGADLGAMADVLRLRLDRSMRLVKWAALSLIVYVVAAVSVLLPSPGGLLRLPAPSLPIHAPAIAILVAVVGTTISPCLFIWQSSLEGERARGLPGLRLPGLHRRAARVLARDEAWRIRVDTWAGMAVAVLLACAIVFTAASTLRAAGVTVMGTTAGAACRSKPAHGPASVAPCPGCTWHAQDAQSPSPCSTKSSSIWAPWGRSGGWCRRAQPAPPRPEPARIP